jgi:hypothetical protein
MIERSDLENAVGFYTPSFFRIHLDTDEDVSDFSKISTQTSAALIHEYVHYLQDLTTTYGLMNISYIVDFIKTVNYNQRGSAHRQLAIPYQLSPGRDSTVYYNSELSKRYSGTINNVHAKVTGLETLEEIVELPTAGGGTTQKPLYSIKLTGTDHNNNPLSYTFGSHSVIESMAYEIERCIYGHAIDAPASLPYLGARFVSDLVYPHFTTNPLNLIALCDWALMDFHPAAQFLLGLQYMWAKDFYPEHPSEIYDFLREELPPNGSFLGFQDYMDLFAFMSVSAAGQLNSYFTTPYSAENKIWFDYIFTKANLIRRQMPDLLLGLASAGPIEHNWSFKSLILNLGMPPTTNRKNHAVFRLNAYIAPNNLVPEMTWAIGQIYNIYINSKKSQTTRCNMKDWCRVSCEHHGIADYTDERCNSAPWSRVHDAPPCAFTEVWKAWGMENEVPTVV